MLKKSHMQVERFQFPVAVLALGVALTGWALTPAGAAEPDATKNKSALVKRGEYLITIASCHDCHTPMKMTPNGPMPDFSRALSGHPPDAAEPTGTAGKADLMLSGSDLTSFRMPWGILYSRNLTPDKTGLGEWTESQFIKALRTGRHQGEGRPLMPPMPWPNVAAMTDDDLKAMFAYLRSIKPIANAVPDPKVPPAAIDQFAKTNQALVEQMAGAHATPPAAAAHAAGKSAPASPPGGASKSPKPPAP